MLAHFQKLLALLWLGSASGWVWMTAGHLHPALVVMGFLCILFAHSSVLAVEFVLLYRQHRDEPAHPVDIPLLVRAWLTESCIALRAFLWEQAFRSQSLPDTLPTDTGRRAVLLVHGYVCNRGLWNPWMRKLRACGIPYRAITLTPPFGSIDDGVAAIDAAIRDITDVTGLAPLVVAHSMGGLSVRAWLRACSADDRVHHVVTIASPHQGAYLARYASTRNARQVRIGSNWLENLAHSEPASRYALFTCFYGHCDNVVFPMKRAVLPGADNRHVASSAHIQMAYRDEVFREAVRLLDAPRVTDDSTLTRPDRAAS